MHIFSILCFCVTMQTITAMFIPEQNNSEIPFQEHTQQNPDLTQANIEEPLNTERPSIRIRINTNGGNAVPYILLKRRPNTNMRLRIQNARTNNGPLRIVYNRSEDMNILERNNNEQQTQPTYPRTANIQNEERLRRKQIVLQNLDARFRIRAGNGNSIRFRQ